MIIIQLFELEHGFSIWRVAIWKSFLYLVQLFILCGLCDQIGSVIWVYSKWNTSYEGVKLSDTHRGLSF